ncbi:MAG: hypothetical protein GYA70_00415 [Deltaproteobacteria bacterium]|nr:hypothetical protein [Deltaproteobacteria bacterium]
MDVRRHVVTESGCCMAVASADRLILPWPNSRAAAARDSTGRGGSPGPGGPGKP